MCAIKDPLGQTYSPASGDVYSHLKYLFCFVRFLKEGTDVQTPRAQIVITTGRDCGSASWINGNNTYFILMTLAEMHSIALFWDKN